MRRVLVAAVLGAALPGVAGAQVVPEYESLVDPLSSILSGCLDQSYDSESAVACNRLTSDACNAMGPGGATTFGMSMCVTILTGLWERAMTERWRQVLEAIPALDRGHLEKEQDAWLDYRDAACRFAVAEVAGGSMAAYVGGYCHMDMTAERVAKFLDILR